MPKTNSPASAGIPSDFLWGASSSAHQVEGGTTNQWTAWEERNARALAEQAKFQYRKLPDFAALRPTVTDPANYISGRLTDHFNRYEQDFELLSQLNLNSFRFSIEWSRIQPGGSEDWDQAAVEHYRRYLAALKRRHITPVVTLWHFSHPEWFERRGGFEKMSNVSYFVTFADRIMRELGQDVRYIVPVNEPDTYINMAYLSAEWPPQRRGYLRAYRTYLNLIQAHRRVYRRLKRHNRPYQVGFNKTFNHYYAADDDWRSHFSVWAATAFFDGFFIRMVSGHYDYLAVNYYFATRVRGLFKINNPPDEPLSDLGWGMQPQYLAPVLLRLGRKYKKPLFITESGVADADDKYRKWWITENVRAIIVARGQGINVIGYLHWAFLDNFEWSHGRWPCFGLIAVNYTTLRRTIRPSARWYAAVVDYFQHSKRNRAK